MAEPTNDAVSDERLRELADKVQPMIDWMRALADDQEGGDAVIMVQRQQFNKIVGLLQTLAQVPQNEALARIHKNRADELNRRSVTSQASEGEVVAWQGDAPDGRRGLTSNSKVAEMWKDVGRTVTPLYASPVSKRVERLETALSAVNALITEAELELRDLENRDAANELALPEYIRGLRAARQALQRGRS